MGGYRGGTDSWTRCWPQLDRLGLGGYRRRARRLAAGVRVFPEGVDRDQQGGEKSKTQARRGRPAERGGKSNAAHGGADCFGKH